MNSRISRKQRRHKRRSKVETLEKRVMLAGDLELFADAVSEMNHQNEEFSVELEPLSSNENHIDLDSLDYRFQPVAPSRLSSFSEPEGEGDYCYYYPDDPSCSDSDGSDAMIQIGNTTATEGSNLSFSVTGVDLYETVTVYLSTSPGTAGQGDYGALSSSSVTLSPSANVQYVSVLSVPDTIPESDETFEVRGSTVSPEYTIAHGTGTILDDDSPPAPTVVISNSAVAEGGTLFFEVEGRNLIGTTVVNLSTSAGSAGTEDFGILSPPNVTLTAPFSSQTVFVPTINDTLPEPDEHFYVNGAVMAGVATISSSGKGTILENDNVYQVVISEPTKTEGNTGWPVTKSSGEVMEFAVSLIPAVRPGEEVSVSVTVREPTSIEANPEYIAEHDIDWEVVTLDPDDNDTLVYPSLPAYHPDHDQHHTQTLTFNSANSNYQKIYVAINGDRIDENNELLIAEATGASVVESPPGVPILVLYDDVQSTGQILDTDSTFSVQIAQDESTTEGNEGYDDPNELRFTVSVSPQPLPGDVIDVGYSISHSSINGASVTDDLDWNDVTNTENRLVFDRQNTSQEIIVEVNGDLAPEDDEEFSVHLSDVSTTTSSGMEISVDLGSAKSGTIVDDDSPYEISIKDKAAVEGNGGYLNPQILRMEVALDRAVNADETVTVDYAVHLRDSALASSADFNDFRIWSQQPNSSSTSGTLSIANGATKNFIHFELNGDLIFELDELFDVVISDPVVYQADPQSGTGIPIAGRATIIDETAVGTINNDDIPIVVSVNNGSDKEAENGVPGSIDFVIELSETPIEPIEVTFETVDGSATAGADYVAQSGTHIFGTDPDPNTDGDGNPNTHTVTVPFLDDNVYEWEEYFFFDVKTTDPRVENDESLPLQEQELARGQGTIVDDEEAPTINIQDAEVEEGEVLRFHIILSHESVFPVPVSFWTEDDSAVHPDDYTGAPNDFIDNQTFNPLVGEIPAGSLSITAEVHTIDDQLVEGTELMEAKIQLIPPTASTGSPPAYAVAGDMVAKGTILDNDYEVSIDDRTFNEGDEWYVDPTMMLFTVSLNPPIRDGHVVTVDYIVKELAEADGYPQDELAKKPADFKVLPEEEDSDPITDEGPASGQIVFGGDDSTSNIIEVAINGDWIPEKDEVFGVELTSAVLTVYEADDDTGSQSGDYSDPISSGPVAIEKPLGIGTIVDDDEFEFDFDRRYDWLGPENGSFSIEAGSTGVVWNDAEGTAQVSVGGDPFGSLHISGPFAATQISHWEIIQGASSFDPDAYKVEIEADGFELEPFYVADAGEPHFAFGKALQFENGDGLYKSEVTVSAVIQTNYVDEPIEFPETKEFIFPVVDLSESAGGAGWMPHETYRILPVIEVDGSRPASLVESDGVGVLMPDGSVWHYTKDGDEYTAPEGMFWELRPIWDGFFRLESPSGDEITFDEQGRAAYMWDRNGTNTLFTYTDGNNDGNPFEIETITYPGSLTTTFNYAGGELVSIVDYAQREWAYDITDDETSITWPDPDGDESVYESAVWRVEQDSDSGLPKKIIDPEEGESVFDFNTFTDYNVDPDSGEERTFDVTRLTGFSRADTAYREIDPLKWIGVVDAATSLSSPFYGVDPDTIEAQVDFLQVSTTTKMDDFQQPVDIVSSNGFVAQIGRNTDGRPVSITQSSDDESSATISYEDYDVRGRVGKITYPRGFVEYEYGAKGQVSGFTDALGRETVYDLDNKGNVKHIYKEIGSISANPANNESGNVSPLTNPIDRYDANNDGLVNEEDHSAIHVSLVLGNSEMNHDVNGNGTVSSRDMLAISNYFLDLNEDIPSQSFGSYTYSTLPSSRAPKQQIETYTDPTGLVTKYEYYDTDQHLGLLRKQIVGFGTSNPRITEYFYDGHRNLQKVKSPRGQYSWTEYDNLGRVKIGSFYDSNDTVLSKSSYGYDSLNALTYSQNDLVTGLRTDYLERDPLSRPKTVQLPSIDGVRSEVVYQYDPDGFIDVVTDPLGRTTEYDFVDGRLDELKTPGIVVGTHATTKYEYTASGAVKNVVTRSSVGNALLSKTTYEYDAEGNLEFSSQKHDNVSTIDLIYNYDDAGRLVSTESNSGVVEYVYDSLDRLAKTKLPFPGFLTSADSVTPAVSTLYNRAGVPFGSRDAVGNFSLSELNEFHETTESTTPDPDGDGPLQPLTAKYNRDVFGRLDSTENLVNTGNGNSIVVSSSAYGYDAFQRVNSVDVTDHTSGDVLSSFTQYDSLGRVTVSQSNDGTTYTYQYDEPALSQPTMVTLSDRNSGDQTQITHYEYDKLGRIDLVFAPGLTTDYEYDNAGYLDWVDTGVKTFYDYDDLGRQTRVADAQHETISVWNYDGTLKRQEKGDNVTHFTYDADGRRKTLTDGSNNVTTWNYDSVGRVASVENTLGDLRSYKYYADGTLQQSKNRDGLITRYEYNNFRQVTSEKWVDPETPTEFLNEFTYIYESNGRLDVVYDDETSINLEYDGFGRLIQEDTSVEGFDVEARIDYHYNDFGDLASRSLTVDQTITSPNPVLNDVYGYDSFARLNSITRHNTNQTNGNGSDQLYATFGYDDLNRLTSVGSGAVTASGANVSVVDTVFDFDSSGRLGSIAHQFLPSTGTGHVDQLTYTNTYYDQTALLHTTGSALDGTQTYTYDAAGQIDNVTSTLIDQPSDYNFDASGNRTSIVDDGDTVSSAITADNRLGNDGEYEYQYNKEGARTRRIPLDADSDGYNFDYQYTDYTWDHRGRLTDVVNIEYGDEILRVRYTYDALNRRVAKHVTGESTYENSYDDYGYYGGYGYGDGSPNNDNIERYVYDGDHLLAVHNEDGMVVEQILHGPNIDQVLAEEHFNHNNGERTDVSFVAADHLGSVRHVLKYDDATETVTKQNHIQYDVFGVEVNESDASVDSRFGFTGRDRDSETDLQYNRARYYDAENGRWISQDPIGFSAGDANLSRYVGNHPSISIDPSGLVDPLNLNPGQALRDFAADTMVAIFGGRWSSTPGVETRMDNGIGGALGGVIRYGSLGFANGLTEPKKYRSELSQMGMISAELPVRTLTPLAAGYHLVHGESAAGEFRYRLVAAGELGFWTFALTRTQGRRFLAANKAGNVDKAALEKLVQRSIKEVAVRNTISVEAQAVVLPKTGVVRSSGLIPKGAPRNVGKVVDESIIQRGPLDWSIVKKKTGETRWVHVQKHGVNNTKKPLHGVFDKDAVFTVQEAWYRAQRLGIKMDETGTLVVPMGRRVGFEGGKLGSGDALHSVTIHTTDGTRIITAYPSR